MNETGFGSFAIRHRQAIAFLCVALCLAGAFAVVDMPSSIFPQTNFPRVVILIDNGVMPASEMMAIITRPVEEAVKTKNFADYEKAANAAERKARRA